MTVKIKINKAYDKEKYLVLEIHSPDGLFTEAHSDFASAYSKAEDIKRELEENGIHATFDFQEGVETYVR